MMQKQQEQEAVVVFSADFSYPLNESVTVKVVTVATNKDTPSFEIRRNQDQHGWKSCPDPVVSNHMSPTLMMTPTTGTTTTTGVVELVLNKLLLDETRITSNTWNYCHQRSIDMYMIIAHLQGIPRHQGRLLDYYLLMYGCCILL